MKRDPRDSLQPEIENRVESPVGIAGAGNWGHALARALTRAGRKVRLWGRGPARARGNHRIEESSAHPPPSVMRTTDPGDLAGCGAVLFTVPTQALHSVLEMVPGDAGSWILCCKGIERETGRLPSEVAAAARGEVRLAVLSGPNFASEVAAGLPAAATLAGEDLGHARGLAQLFAGSNLRLYPSADRIGVQVAGALKNVIAIAAGVVAGRELGENARAALVTRGLAEIRRLAVALGGDPATLAGLAGLGDLMLTCSSRQSRNFRFGEALARGAEAASLLAPGKPLVEGAWTAPAACRLARRYRTELPICEAVAAVVAGRRSLDRAIDELLARPPAACE